MKLFSKSFIIFNSIIIVLGVLSACSRADLLSYIADRDNKAYRDMLDSVFATLDSAEKEGLKNLFAVTVVEENPDLGNQIDAFFKIYKGPMEIEDMKISASGVEYIESGKRQSILYNAYDIIIAAGGVRYYIEMKMCSQDGFDKDNEGIHILEFATDEAYNSKYFAPHNEEDDGRGFYYQDSPERRDDIRWIEGQFWKYTYYDRALTADDLRAVVEKDDDFQNLVDIIGEPNSLWTVYGYYYYELENGLFAVCKLDDDVRPRNSSGYIERPDAIVAVYIADEENNLETVWMADDIVKVYGDYCYFVPIDRELSEDFFVSFIARGNSLSQLKDEIGPPNIDGKWYHYYEISGNRFVGYSYSGDNIEWLFVADSENILYTIWEAEPSDD